MNKYKPEYLGKVIPANDPSKLTDFVANKYDAFSKIYDTCKTESEGIKDIKTVDSVMDSKVLSVKISADKDVIEKIKDGTKNDDNVTMKDDVITAGTN